MDFQSYYMGNFLAVFKNNDLGICADVDTMDITSSEDRSINDYFLEISYSHYLIDGIGVLTMENLDYLIIKYKK